MEGKWLPGNLHVCLYRPRDDESKEKLPLQHMPNSLLYDIC